MSKKKTRRVCEFATEEQKNAWWPLLCQEYDSYVVLAEAPAIVNKHQPKSRWKRRILAQAKQERIIELYAEKKGCQIIEDPTDRSQRCKKLFIMSHPAKQSAKDGPKHVHREPIGVWRARKELGHETRVRRARLALGLTG